MSLLLDERFHLHPHAHARACERATVAPEVLTAQVEGPRGPIFVGFSAGSNRAHVLTYAHAADEFFVLICNMRTQIVVTVLTLTQYETTHGPIDENRKAAARRNVVSATQGPEDAPIHRERIYASCRVQDLSGRVRTVALGWLALDVDGMRPSALSGDARFIAGLRGLAATKQIVLSSVVDVRLQETRKHPSVELPCGAWRSESRVAMAY